MSAFEASSAVLLSRSGCYELTVELAQTDAQIHRGLMHRETLPARHGMLFDMRGRGSPAMWMKNVSISLDMLFLDASGSVLAIITNAVPHSTKRLHPGIPFTSVLELPAGRARYYAIRKGDRVVHALFDEQK